MNRAGLPLRLNAHRHSTRRQVIGRLAVRRYAQAVSPRVNTASEILRLES
jgi:hypothetical protein